VQNSVSLLSMVLSVVGISIGWLPGVGWMGFAICLVAACLGIVGLSQRKKSGSEIGYCVAGGLVCSLGLPWILAFQIKHAGGGLDFLLVPLPILTLMVVGGISLLVYWIAQLVGLAKARVLFMAIALVAMISMTASVTSVWTYADRQLIEERDE
jgi:hypothetical protein